MRLNNKVAFITGGARGIGRAFAQAYVREGATVVIADLDLVAAERTAADIGPACSAIRMNVADVKSIQAGVDLTVERTGRIDILVNNAALFDLAPLLDITPESYHRLFGVNVHGVLFTMQAVARHMLAAGKGGKIINMASQAGRRGEALVAVYCATKAAVISLTQSGGLNLIRHGINVNAIAPGVVDGEHWDHVDALFAKYEGLPKGEKKRQVGEGVPYGRMGKRNWLDARSSWRARTATMSCPRPTMSMAVNG